MAVGALSRALFGEKGSGPAAARAISDAESVSVMREGCMENRMSSSAWFDCTICAV